jgi:dTDP-4-amino-4,6-dideoxygalactose transaminase
MACDLKPGDEIIVPSFTFIATANAARFVGAKPVFADIENDTFGLDPNDVLEKITDKTRAILPIHFGGAPCKIEELREIADDHKLILIEDSAEAMGTRISGKLAGTFGDSAVLSFCQNKIITTGEGGAIVTQSKQLYEKMKLIRSHGRLETADYFNTTAVMDYVTLGYNFRMPTLNAALGISQLNKIGTIISQRRDSAEYYNKKIKSIHSGLKIPKVSVDNFHVYQLFSVIAEKRDEFMKFMEREGIMTKIYFSPVHLTHYYKDILKYRCRLPVTEKVADSIISLPFYTGISRSEIDIIVNSIATFYKGE